LDTFGNHVIAMAGEFMNDKFGVVVGVLDE
jgi:hypothetical protein